MDPIQYIAHFHAADLRADADRYRLGRAARRDPLRRRRVVRLYARLWWASRPRAATWAPGLLDATAR